ncbi:uncharacterized protein LOC128998281 isoform X2 [Macrosteles quadrilineatus]|uniref:uncharacterized protein LOC128998281 isoform X2 n=1 Tax=Macrosteles quadrilineatus TaxID=74068 RepID=UPI0023E30EB5|nr:uncharacterized protein LOC128998281 isoform X2 [Macrosteles quadrilineatus]
MVESPTTGPNMLLVLMCVMMKILEYSSGTLVDVQPPPQQIMGAKKTRKRRKRTRKRGVAGQPRGMTTEEKLASLHSPESDCNSNTLDSTASYLSNTSSQDVDFIQDNSDYQWFLDYGYRETQHRSILSLSASYEEGCYDDLARDLDTQLAQVDMEDFRAEDILTTLPAMCCQDLQEEEEEEGAQCESMCKSGPLFSPVRESPLPQCPNYSVDSLDCQEQDILLTCQANKDNYTIAFEGSTVMGEDSDCHDTGESVTGSGSGSGSGSGTWSSAETRRPAMANSDAPRTTWCKMVTRRNLHNNCMRHSSASLPNLTRSRPNLGCVKLYDVQHSSSVSGSDSSLSSEKQHSRLSLVRLFIKQRGCAMAHSDYATTQTTHEQLCDNRVNANLVTSDRNQNQVEWVSFADSLIDEVPESESVERLSDGSVSVCSCDASLNTSRHQGSGNNNNSLDRDYIRSPVSVSQLRRGTQTHSECSTSSDPTEATKISAHVRNSATQCPLHCVDASMQTSATLAAHNKQPTKTGEKGKQAVYVMYPNYTLPDLGFLRDERLDLDQIFLTPVKFSPGWTPLQSPTVAPTNPPHVEHKRPRPHSCADIDHLRKKGFSHVRDWESLAVLLPPEYCALLSDIPELREYKDLCTTTKPLFCVSPPLSKPTQFTPFIPDSRNNSSSSSVGTQPSSGYRGSSTLLSDSSANPSPGPHSANNPLFVYRYDSATSDSGHSGPPLPKRSISLPEEKNVPAPPRPPLPRGILRNSLENTKLHKNQANKKRHSMFDMETANVDDPELADVDKKAKAKQSSGSQLSGSDEGLGGEMWRPPTPPTTHALRLQQLLEMSGDQWDPRDMDVLRQQVSRFLSQGRKSVSFADSGEDPSMTPPNSPQVSVAHKPTYQIKTGAGLNETTITEDLEVSFSHERLRHSAKSELVDVVTTAAAKLVAQSNGPNELVSSVALSCLCPALYSLLSDGLKSSLDTPFGDINNSVWQVVEASAQQGPMTKALNELVLKLNSEDVLTEGVVKFNAFIFGLLNVQGLDVWLSYLRTRESVLRRHYSADALMLCACRGQTNARALSDKLLASLRPLGQLNFKLDLLYETRLLHQSLLQLSRLPSSPSHSGSSASSKGSWALHRLMESPPPQMSENVRPRSCVDCVTGADVAGTQHKRWSVNIGGKLGQAYDRLGDDTEEEYTDSLETGGRGNVGNGEEAGTGEGSGKFRRLQMKWEMLSGRENTSQESLDKSSSLNTPPSPVKSSTSSVSSAPKSRIPRPVTSPVRPTSQGLGLVSQPGTVRPPIKKALTGASQLRRPSSISNRAKVPEGPVKARTSRVDAPAKTGPVARPSSLPYRVQRAPSVDSHRRAASSSTIRQHQTSQPHRFVVTLSHRLPSDSGHLAYNEGERLRLVLEVDETWLLCCRGDTKGLVPRTGVIPVSQRI